MTWKTTPLGKVAKVISGYAFKSGDFITIGIPVIKIKNIQREKIDLTDVQYLTPSNLSLDKKYHVTYGDILISLTGSHITLPNSVVGRVAQYRNEATALLNQRVGKIIVTDINSLDNEFLYHWLCQNSIRTEIAMFGQGAANQCNISPSNVESLWIPIPPISTQKRIASILSSYDDLIENNLKRIRLLEEAAQMIYREWFVEMRFPGYEEVEWYVDEKGRRLPEGWKELPLSSVIDYKEGPGLRNYQYRDSGIPFLNIRVIKDGTIDLTAAKFLDEQEVENKYSHFLLEEYDHVISTSGTLGRVATIRNVHLPLCLNTSIIRMRPKDEIIGKWMVKQIITSKEFLDVMNSMATGSAQLNFGPMHLNQMTVIAPGKKLCLYFENYVDSIELLLMNLRDQNILLKEARDILLPRLMDGRIQV